MALVLKNLLTAYTTHVVNKRDTRLDDFPLFGSPWTVTAILAGYWLFVKKIGPKLMEDRKPFELRNVLKFYNISQVLINTYFTYIGIDYLYHVFKYQDEFSLCLETDYSNNQFALYGVKLGYLYFLDKIYDLLDTVFFVLRKRYNQITFLHVYHHIIIIVGTWVCIQYMAAGQSSLLPVLNSFVHAIMYGYYYLTSQYPQMKEVMWWKKYITQLQLTQFAILLSFYMVPVISKECKYPKVMSTFGAVQNGFMLAMFSNFYHKTYSKPSKKIL